MVLGVAFSHDGKTIASASTDKTIKFWNLENKQPKTLKRHQNYVYSVAFSPDGKTLASASEDKTVILWNLADLEFGKLMQDACAVMGGYLKHNAPTSDRDLCKNVGG